MVNKVILIGNVGADPEVRYLEGGVAVANLRLATTERYKNKNGENIDHLFFSAHFFMLNHSFLTTFQ